MSLTSGLIPIGQGSSEGGKAKKVDLDLEFDDAELDDLLMSSDENEKTKTPAKSKPSLAVTKETDDPPQASTAKPVPATSTFPTSRSSLPSSSTLPRPSSAASLASHSSPARPSFSIPQPQPAIINLNAKPAASTSNNVNDILKGLADLDDLDSDLFKPRNATPSNRNTPVVNKDSEESTQKPGTTKTGAASAHTLASAPPKPAMPWEKRTAAVEEPAATANAPELKPAQTNPKAEVVPMGAALGDIQASTTKPLMPWEKRATAGENPPRTTAAAPDVNFAQSNPKGLPQSGVGRADLTASVSAKPLMPWEKRAAVAEKPVEAVRTSSSIKSGIASAEPPSSGRRMVQELPKNPISLDGSDDDVLDLLDLGDGRRSSRKPSQGSGRSTLSFTDAVTPKTVSGRSGATPVQAARPSTAPNPVAPVTVSTNARPSTSATSNPASGAKPKSAASDDDDFIPSFLFEASGPRRSGRPRREELLVEAAKPQQRPEAPAPRTNLPFLDAKPKLNTQEPSLSSKPVDAVPGHLLSTSGDTGDTRESRIRTATAPLPNLAKAKAKKEGPLHDASGGGKAVARDNPGAAQTKKAAAASSILRPSINVDKLVRSDTSLSSIASLSPTDEDDDSDQEGEAEEGDDDDEEEIDESGSELQDIDLSDSDVGSVIVPKKPAALRSKSSTSLTRRKSEKAASVQQDEVPALDKRLAELEKEKARIEADLQAKLAVVQQECQEKTTQLKGMEAKFAEERATIHDQCSADKRRIEEENSALISKIKEAHIAEVERLRQTHKEDLDRARVLEAQKATVEREEEIAALKQAHLDEMAKIISNAEGARQLEMLAGKIENSSRFVDSMQQKLESEHAYSIKEREASFQLREKQITEMQKHLIDQQRELDEERIKIQDLVKTMETNMREAKRHHEEERRRITEERAKLEAQMAELKAEKDEALGQLHAQRIEFIKSKEEWAVERRRISSQLTEERKVLAMEKATVEAQKHAVAELETEMQQLRAREEAQLHADRLVLDRETHTLQSRLTDLHKETVELRAEKLRLDGLRAQLDVERTVFENTHKAAERAVKDAAGMRESAVKERQQASERHSEAEQTRSQLDAARAELEKERLRLEQERKRFYDERLALADERRKMQLGLGLSSGCRKENDENSIAPQYNRPHDTPEKWAHTRPPFTSKIVNQTVEPKTSNMVNDQTMPPAAEPNVRRPAYTRSGYPYSQYSNPTDQTARQLFQKLNRFVGGLKQSETVLDGQLDYLSLSTNGSTNTFSA